MKYAVRLAVLSLFVPLVGISTPAQAGTPTTVIARDSRGDMDVWHLDTGHGTTAPRRRLGDLTGLRVRHGRDHVRLQVWYAALRPPAMQFAVVVPIRTRTRFVNAAVNARGADRNGAHALYTRGFDDLPCDRMRHYIDYEHDFINLVIPRACLGNPRWVQTRARTIWIASEDLKFGDHLPNLAGSWMARTYRQS